MQNSGSKKRDCLFRALKPITLFQEGRELTVHDVSRELGVNVRNGYYWLDAVSLLLPIYNPNETIKGYHDCLTYKMLDTPTSDVSVWKETGNI